MQRNQYMVRSVGTYRNLLRRDDQCNECNRDIDYNQLGILYMAKIHLKKYYFSSVSGSLVEHWPEGTSVNTYSLYINWKSVWFDEKEIKQRPRLIKPFNT